MTDDDFARPEVLPADPLPDASKASAAVGAPAVGALRRRAPLRVDSHPPTAKVAARPTTSAATIRARLFEAIVGMDLPPGTRLQDKALCAEFGVSRTPVREALLRLAEEGLVDIFPQSGTFVAAIPVAAIAEAVLIRQALEGLTVEAAAERADAASLLRLDDLLAESALRAKRGDMRAFHAADEAFHATIADCAGHPGIWRLLAQVKVQIDRARRLTLPVQGRMEYVVAEHLSIRDAIAAGDGAAARAAMTAHLSVVIPDVEWLRSRHPGYFV